MPTTRGKAADRAERRGPVTLDHARASREATADEDEPRSPSRLRPAVPRASAATTARTRSPYVKTGLAQPGAGVGDAAVSLDRDEPRRDRGPRGLRADAGSREGLAAGPGLRAVAPWATTPGPRSTGCTRSWPSSRPARCSSSTPPSARLGPGSRDIRAPPRSPARRAAAWSFRDPGAGRSERPTPTSMRRRPPWRSRR